MATGDGIEGADIVRLTQNGQNLYTQGRIREAVKEFQKAHYYAVRLNHKKTLETCAFNLASAYAANKNGRKALEHLRTLSRSFMDSVDEGELTFLFGLAEQHNTDNIQTVRVVEHYRNALEQLNRLQSNMHASLKKYILEQLCELEKNDSIDLIDYMHQLADVYAYLKMPFRRLWLLCERANLLYKMNQEDDAIEAAENCFIVIKELQGKKVTHLAGKDSEMQETMEQCLDVADNTHASNQLVPILNEIGLLFTQLQDTDQALECFKKAHHILSEEDRNCKRNDSVLLQNIGAVYNFKIVHTLDLVPQALSYHTMALKQYGKQKNGKSQGHCYLNKAYAESRRQDMTGAQEAYILALHKAEEKDDFRTQWQALEGLGTVACINRDWRKAQEYLHQALKLVHQDEKDITQSTASERILEKLLQLNRGKGSGREVTRAGIGIDTLISRIGGPDQSMRSTGPRSRSAPQDVVDKLTKKEKRELKVRRSGSLRRFPKVARGLAADTPDLTLRESDEESLTSLTSEQTLSSDSSSTTSSNSSDSEVIPRSRQKVAISKGDGRQTITPRMSMRRPEPKSSSSMISRRQSQKGLKTSLLLSESDDDDDKQAVIDAYRQLNSNGEDDEESDSQVSEDYTARTPRKGQGHTNPSTKQGSDDDEESIKEKLDDHVDTDVRTKKGQSSHATKNDAQTSAVKREGSGLSGTKSLRFQSPVDTTDEEEEDNQPPTNNRSRVEVDVHQPQRSVPSDRRPKGKIAPPVVESESEYDSDSDSLSEEETEVARQAPPLPTQSPPVSPSNTYEKPVSKKTLMRDNSLYEDASRQSTGHYAEIDFSNTDSARQQGEMASDVAMLNRKMRRGPNYFNSSDENETKEPHSEKSKTASEKSGAGETSRSVGESTVYETIRPPDSTRSDYVTSDSARSAAERDESGYARDHSTDESEEESGRGLSRAEKDQQMLKYHLQQQQEREEEEKKEEEEEDEEEKKKDRKGKSKTCVIS